MKRLGRWAGTGLTIAFIVLFLGSLGAHFFASWVGYNQEAAIDGVATISPLRYLASSAFWVEVMENWQSEYLQFTVFILATVWLVQRGSAESKQPDHGEEPGEGPARATGRRWWRAHSLGIVMTAIFFAAWSAQALTGWVSFNETRLRDFVAPLGLFAYLQHPDFWSRTLQNWQSEFLAVASMSIFSVYLRQQGSPESKDVDEPNGDE